MPRTDNNPTKVEESDESDQESSSSIEFDPDSEDAFNAVMKLDTELLRPFCFAPTWPENTAGYREEFTDNAHAQFRALEIIKLPQAKMTLEQIAELTEEEPELIRHVPRIEAARTKTIIMSALGRVSREQGQGGLESRRLALELGLMRPVRPSYKPVAINASSTTSGASVSDSKANTDGNKIRVAKGNSETLEQKDREQDIDQEENKSQPVYSPPMSQDPILVSHNQEHDLKSSKSPFVDTGAEENSESVGIHTTPAQPILSRNIGKSDSNADAKGERRISEGNGETFSQSREHDIDQVTTQNQPINSPPMTITPIPLLQNQEHDLNSKSSKSLTGESGAVGKRKFPKFWRSG